MTDERDQARRELARAEADAASYQEALALLRPLMEGTDRTLGEVLADPANVALLDRLRRLGWGPEASA